MSPTPLQSPFMQRPLRASRTQKSPGEPGPFHQISPKRLVFLRNRDLEAIERISEVYLARQARLGVAMCRAIEQVIFIFGDRIDLISKGWINMDVAGRARAATAAQREQLIKARIADDFHDRQAGLTLNRLFRSVARDNNQLRHAYSSCTQMWISARR